MLVTALAAARSLGNPGARPLAWVVLASALMACGPVPSNLGHARDAIIQGTPDDGDPAVVWLAPICTGTIIAPRVVLTAAHCVDRPSVLPPSVTFADSRTVPLLEGRPHPRWERATFENDLALVLLAAPANVVPAPLLRQPLEDSSSGQPLRLVGFGVTDPAAQDSVGIKRTGVTTLRAILAMSFTDDSAPQATCAGDSGGPAFLRVDGGEVIAGVASRGDSACRAYGVKTRVDVFIADFIDPYIRWSEPGAAADGERCAYAAQCANPASTCRAATDNPDFHFCSAPCRADRECPAPLRCEAGACQYPPPSPGAVGAPCETDNDCAGQLCRTRSAGGPRTCTVMCSPDAPSPCGHGQACEATLAGTSAEPEFACFASPARAGCAAAPGAPEAGALGVAVVAALVMIRRRSRGRDERGPV